jgi:hypothetical protein
VQRIYFLRAILMKFFVYSCAIMEALQTEAQMSNWNDDRLDHLDRRVDEGFKRMDQEFKKVDKRLERIEDQFHRLNYTLITGAIGIIIALIGFHA